MRVFVCITLSSFSLLFFYFSVSKMKTEVTYVQRHINADVDDMCNIDMKYFCCVHEQSFMYVSPEMLNIVNITYRKTTKCACHLNKNTTSDRIHLCEKLMIPSKDQIKQMFLYSDAHTQTHRASHLLHLLNGKTKIQQEGWNDRENREKRVSYR